MLNNKDSGSLDEQKIASFLQEEVKRVEGASNAQIDELKQVAKLFKKNVPFTRRSYVLAHLLKNATASSRVERGKRVEHQFKVEKADRPMRADKGEHFERTERFDRSERTRRGERQDVPTERRGDERRERPARISLDPAVSNTIFVGIGKARSVHPRDMVGLLVGVAGLEKSRIGEIRVLPNYSFVQLYSSDCQKAIDALDGYEYRGRKLSVSFSRKKDEDDAAGDVKKVSDTEQTSDEADEVETTSADVATREPLAQQADDTPVSSDTPMSSIKDTSSEDTTSDGTLGVQVQPENQTQGAQDTQDTQDTTEGFETSDDGQVRSHFGDGATY